jgi:hypothetical protein
MEAAENDNTGTVSGKRRHEGLPGGTPAGDIRCSRRLVSIASHGESAALPHNDAVPDAIESDGHSDGRHYDDSGRRTGAEDSGIDGIRGDIDGGGPDDDNDDDEPSPLDSAPRLPPEMIQYVMDILPLRAWLTVSKTTNEMMRRSPGAPLRSAMSLLAREGHAGKWQPRSPYKRVLVDALANVLDIELSSRVPHAEAMFWCAYRYLSEHDDQHLRANRHVIRVIASEALGLAARFDLAQTLFASLESGIPMIHPISVSVAWPPGRRASPAHPQPVTCEDEPRRGTPPGGSRRERGKRRERGQERVRRDRTFFFGDARGVFRWMASVVPPIGVSASDGAGGASDGGSPEGPAVAATAAAAATTATDSYPTSTSTSTPTSTSTSTSTSRTPCKWTTRADARAFARGLIRGGWDAYHMAWMGMIVTVFPEVCDRFGSEIGLRTIAREQSPARLREVAQRLADTLSSIPP